MEKNKTIKISVDEKHTDFEKTKVKPTKLFDLDQLDDFSSSEFNEMSTQDLEYKLNYESLSEEEIRIIKHILATRKNG